MLELNQLYNMDCLEGMKDFPDNYFDLAIVDPPYGIERFKKGGSHLNKYGNENQQWNNKKPNKEYFQELKRISKNHIIWGGNNFELEPTEYFIIWSKPNMPNGMSFASCEFAWTNIKIPAKMYSKHSSIEKRIHPTQKPVGLYKWLLKNYAKPGYKIIDTHVGSASSIIAFIDEGFDYIGFEIDKDYYEAAQHRINEFRKQGKLFQAGT